MEYKFLLPVDLMPALNEKLAKAKKLAKRFGTPEPTVSIGPERKLRGVNEFGHGYNYMGVDGEFVPPHPNDIRRAMPPREPDEAS